MASAGILRIKVVGDTSPFQKSLSGLGGKIGGFAKKVGKVGAGAVIGLGAAAGTAAFKTAAMGDEIAKSSRKAGIGVEQFQELRFAFGQGGVEASKFDTAVLKFNKRLGESATTGGTADEAFASLGVSLRDADGNVREAGGALDEVLPKLAAIESDAERAAVAGDLFGQRVGPELAAALADGGEGIDAARQKAQDLGIVMDEDATKAAEKFTDQWDDLKQQGSAFLRQFGTPVMSFMSGTLFPIIQDKVIPALKQFGEWIGPRLQEAGQWIGEFFNNVVLPAFRGLSDWWTVNGPAIITAAQTLWEGLQGAFAAVTELWNSVVGMFQSGGESTTGVFAEIQAFVAEVWPQIQAIIASAMDAIQAVIERVTAIVQGIWTRWGEDIMAWMSVVWETIQSVISGALDIIQGIWETFAGLFSGDWERMWDGIKQVLSGAWEAIKGIVDLALENLYLLFTIGRDAVQELWGKLWDWVKDTASEAWDKLKEGVSDGVDDVVGFFRDLPGNMLSALGDLGSILLGAGRSILQGLWDGMTEKWDELTGWIGGLGGRMRELKGPIEKDRVLLTDIGEAIIGGLGAGMDDEWAKVEKRLGTMTAEIPVTVASAASPARMPAGRFGTDGGVTVNVYGDVVTDSPQDFLDQLGQMARAR